MLKFQTNQTMRLILLIVILFISCKSKTDLIFYAIKDGDFLKIESSLTIDEFIKKSGSLDCQGYRIIGSTQEIKTIKRNEFIIFNSCPNKIIDYDGIQLPIYSCNGFRKYGINLCDDCDLNIEQLSEFYLNPKRRADYPSKPNKAILKIIVDENRTAKSIFPIIKKLKTMRNQIGDNQLSELPLLFSLQTIQKDTIEIQLPE